MKSPIQLLSLLLIFCIGCKGKGIQEPEVSNHTEIKMITLYRSGGMMSMEQPIKSVIYIIDNTTTYIVKELRAPDGKMLEVDTLKKQDNSDYNGKPLFNLVPQKEINQVTGTKTFGSPGATDDGGWGATIILKDGKSIDLLFDNREQNIPDDFKALYQLLIHLENQHQ